MNQHQLIIEALKEALVLAGKTDEEWTAADTESVKRLEAIAALQAATK